MENIKTTTTVKHTTTVREITVSFDHDGAAHTAEFEHTEHRDAAGKRIYYDCAILNQIALPVMSDEEDNTLWSLAETVPSQPEVKNAANLLECIQGIDWALLKDLKLQFLYAIERDDVPEATAENINVLISMLDSLQDAVVADRLITEGTAFPETERSRRLGPLYRKP